MDKESPHNQQEPSTGSSFTTNSTSVRIGTEIRQSLLADHALVAGSGSPLEAMLIAEVHWLRGTPGFIGAATTVKEVQDLVVSVDKRVLLFLVDSIAKDKGLALLSALADTPYPPLIAHLSNCESWASREELDHFPAHALLSSHSIGTGKVNAALATILGGGRYCDEELIQSLQVTEAACSILNQRERMVAACVAQGQTNREIAAGLFIAETTVRDYVSGALKKLGLANRAALAAWSVANRLA